MTWQHYLGNVGVATNQWLNAVLAGEPDEMLSARAHRQHLKGRSGPRNCINAIFWWQPDHCLKAYHQEVRRKQLPPVYGA
jgi:hypothetical protein